MNHPAAPGSHGAGRRRWQLPADVSGFVGRSGELARLADLLSVARLVTIAGPGGVGKTRLALRAAADAAYGGSCLVELSGLSRPGAAARHRRAAPRPAARERCQPARRGARRAARQEGAAAPRHLRAPDRRLRAVRCHGPARDGRHQDPRDERQPLHVEGEEVLRLGPLPVPGSGEVSTAGDAVELFTQRAAAAVTGFTLTETDLEHAITLCRRLDGIPLAIELAAVRVRALPVAELAARVEAGTRGGDRQEARHHQPASDAARGHRMVLRALHRCRESSLAATVGVRGDLRREDRQ